MTKEYDNTNRGVIFINNRKEKENHPDYTGTINVGGTEYYLSGWKKEGRTGTFLSLSVKPKEAQDGFLNQKPTNEGNTNKPASKEYDPGSSDFDDDIPF